MARKRPNICEPTPPKGYHWEFELDGFFYHRHEPELHIGDNFKRARAYWVRDGFHGTKCPGEAHSNAFIDNCGMCMPNWGIVAVPNNPTPPEEP